MSQHTTPSNQISDDTCVLISFCNQLLSPNYSLGMLDVVSGSLYWIDLSDIPSTLRKDFSGVTGICRVDNGVVFATQGASPALAYISNGQVKVTSHIALQHCKDTHSLVFQDGYIYLVSTGTNEIYRMAFHHGQFGQEERFWGYPGVSYDKDDVHLNGLTIDRGRLVASCFGPRKADGSVGGEGRVFYVDSDQTIHGGLSQPHSPTIDGGCLVFAESKAQKIYIYNKTQDGNWCLEKDIFLNGYTRGVVLKKDRILVGISADRKLSRSQRRPLEPEERGSIDSAIVELNIDQWQIVSQRNLVGFGREVYDLINAFTQFDLLPELGAVYMRLRDLEATGYHQWLDIEMLRRLQNDQKQEINTLRCDQQQKIDELRNLQNEIMRFRQSSSWRITAPLRLLMEAWYRLRLK